MTIFNHPEFDQHQQIVFCNDQETGLKAIIAIHNTHRGPALGGCRMWNYANDDEALTDVLRLSKGMTYKSALANLALGGGKSVIIGDPRQNKSKELLAAMGRFLEQTGNQYIAAEDSGTSVPDLKIMGQYTANVAGVTDHPGIDGQPSNGDPSPATAYGTFIGLKAAVKHRLNITDIRGLKVAIQGIGNVGYRLAEYLRKEGAELLVSDINPELVEKAVNELGAKAIPLDQILLQEVDVVSPCALGASLNDETIPLIKAKVIAGAANNQLARPVHDRELHERGILYAPDYAINAGGIIDISYERSGYDAEKAKAHIEGIGDTLNEIFNRSAKENRPTGEIADELAVERLS